MKYRFLLLLFSLTFILSCGEDEDPIPSDRTILNYDGDNITAPNMIDGLYEFAVRFPPVLTRNVQGRSIEQVSFYIYEIPDQVYLNISSDRTPTLPGQILNTQMLNNLSPNSWNTITLDTPFNLDGTAVWVGIEVFHDRQMQSVGCDAGPAQENGDWLYVEADQTWDTFRNTLGESINWNIRAVISEN